MSDGRLTATIEELPSAQSRAAVQAMVSWLREQTSPEPLQLLRPIAIVKDSVNEGERLAELK